MYDIFSFQVIKAFVMDHVIHDIKQNPNYILILQLKSVI